jgi:putative tricarboxylic transport membrane protein
LNSFQLKRSMIKGVVATCIFAAASSIASFSYAQADNYPSRPITVVVPFSTGGQNDRMARAMAPFLQKYLGQPIQIVNKGGAGAQLGHTYFLQQPDDGYTILQTSVNYIPLNIGLTKAPFKLDDFEMVNLPSNDYTILATASDSKIKSLEQVLSMLKKDPKSVSIGVQPASADLMNLTLLLDANGIDIKNVRVVTFAGGGPARNAVLGGTVDVGLVGAEGFIPIKERILGLALFDKKRSPDFPNVPSIEEIAKKGKFVADYVPGSQRGWVLHSTMKAKNPKQHAALVKAITQASQDPEFIKIAKGQSLPVEWYGPQQSQKMYLNASSILLINLDSIRAK